MEIPPFYQHLLRSPGAATLSVLKDDGSIHSSLVWPDYDGEFIKLNMVSDTPTESSIRKEETATLLVAHRTNENMYISLGCRLQKITHMEAIQHLNMLTRRNKNLSNWYGDVEAEDAASKEKRVIVYLKPEYVYFT